MAKNWKVASDIGDRLKDVRTQVYDVGLVEFADIVFKARSTVSGWEGGTGQPGKRFLRQLAKRIGAPVEIFREGGPLPSEGVNGPVNNAGETLADRLASARATIAVQSRAILRVNAILGGVVELGEDGSDRTDNPPPPTPPPEPDS